MLGTWLPHYLTWPWWTDLDTLATIAQGWDAGILPYRDVALFNFPGQIELFWLLGKCFGWGRTAPIYAFDAALLVILGLMMSAWSSQGFGRVSPGLVGFVAFVHYYLGLDYAVVAQRDWHAPALVVLGIMLVQGWPGRPAWIGAGLLFGMAFVIRPHVILFMPAAALAVAMSALAGSAGAGQGSAQTVARWKAPIFALLACAVAAGIAVAAGFAPLAAQGLLGDMVRGVRQASYGQYGEYPVSFVKKVVTQLGDLRLAAGYAMAASVVLWSPRILRRLALPWLTMLILVLIYKPLHPLPHAYLVHPLWLIWSTSLAVVAGTAMTLWRQRSLLKLAAAGFLLVLACPGAPRFCDLEVSSRALGELGRGSEPAIAPPGAAARFAPENPYSPYTWDQYRELLAYLRQRTAPRTQVANLLRNMPFPMVNGCVGRISPLRTEAGIMWLYSLDTGREVNFARYLEQVDDAVVVWIPGERSFDSKLQLPLLERTVPEFYRPEARLSGMQVWRRIPRSH
jgi:hypothetical protein